MSRLPQLLDFQVLRIQTLNSLQLPLGFQDLVQDLGRAKEADVQAS